MRSHLGIRLCRTSKGTPDAARVVLGDDVLDRRICTTSEDCNADQECAGVQDGEGNVPPAIVPLADLDELEPEERREVECETGDEERGDQTKQCIEEGNSFSDDPANDCNDSDQHKPDPPRLRGCHKADWAVGERAVHDEAADNSTVDTAGDEDDRESDSEGDARNGVTSRQKSRRLDILSNKRVNEATCQCVDEDLDQAKRPDRFDVVFWSVHLRHE